MLKPKCHKFKGAAYVSSGHLLPCCWCDTIYPEAKEEFIKLGFFFEDLKLENNDTIEDILMSDVWIDFHKKLIKNPEEAPLVCKKNCTDE
jgi:hypothetical protein